jgi:DNA-binding HxlR family transcriptional regulator
MSKEKYEENLESRARLFKALGHPVRLLIINLVRDKARHGEELAAILGLNSATVSHHLSQLTAAGILQSEKDQYYQMYSLTGEILMKSIDEVVKLPQAGLQASVAEDAYRDKVLKTFLKHGRLIKLPAQQKKFQVILSKLLEEFEPDQEYTEREVNQILLEFHDDVASLRRGMIEYDMMTRAKGIYRRPAG